MDSQRPNRATETVETVETVETIETAVRSGSQRTNPDQPPRPHVFRRKIDCDGRSGVTGQRREVRGARSPNREERFVY